MRHINQLKQNYGSLFKLDIWRGRVGVTKDSHLIEFDADHYLVKEEITHYGAKKVILKDKKSGKIIERLIE